MNSVVRNIRNIRNIRNTCNTRSTRSTRSTFNTCTLLAHAATMLLSWAALVACQSPPPNAMASAVDIATPAPAMAAPQAPFDTTPITPVESAGAAAE